MKPETVHVTGDRVLVRITCNANDYKLGEVVESNLFNPGRVVMFGAYLVDFLSDSEGMEKYAIMERDQVLAVIG